MSMWPIHVMAVLPVPAVSAMSQTTHKLPSDHLQVCLVLDAISGESGPIAPFSSLPVPFQVPARNCSFLVSSPGLGGISGGVAGLAVAAGAAAAGAASFFSAFAGAGAAAGLP